MSELPDPAASAPAPPDGELGLSVGNEFALVDLRLDHGANGTQLRITSGRTGRSALLDPMALEVLTWLPVEEIVRHLETPFGPEEADLTPTDFIERAERAPDPGPPEPPAGPAMPGRS